MYRLYHYPICPFSRKIRVLLTEKKLSFFPVVENFWERREKYIRLNPMANVPMIIAKPDLVISDSQTIAEFLEEEHPNISLMLGSPQDRAEIRRTIAWFDGKFYDEVVGFVLNEKVYNFFKTGADPDHELLKIARQNLSYHMRYLQFLIAKRNWIAGDELSLADITAACHLSSLDYLGEINWNNYPVAKEWYAIIKSRPSFRDVLQDMLSGFRPAPHYRELDF